MLIVCCIYIIIWVVSRNQPQRLLKRANPNHFLVWSKARSSLVMLVKWKLWSGNYGDRSMAMYKVMMTINAKNKVNERGNKMVGIKRWEGQWEITREMMEQLGMMGVMLGVAALMVSSPPLVSPYSSNQWQLLHLQVCPKTIFL